MSPQRRIGTALLGTGECAGECYAPAMLQNPDMHLRALWSQEQASAERFNLEVAGCSLEVFHGDMGLDQLLLHPNVEAVVVALSPEVQAEYVRRILASGKHVLSEKPVALDRHAAGATLRWLEGTSLDGLVWFVAERLACESIFQPAHLRLQELGPIMAAELHAVLVVEQGPTTRSDDSLFIEGGVQHVTLLRQLLGQITEVNCIRRSRARHGEQPQEEGLFQEDIVSGTLRFDKGIVAAVNWQTSGQSQDERFRLTLWGANGNLTVELDMGAQATTAGLRCFTLRRQLLSGSGSQAAASVVKGAGIVESFPSDGTARQLEAWVKAVQESRLGRSCSSDRGPMPVAAEADQIRSPIAAIVDLMVVSAMLQSNGTGVQIKEKPLRR